MDRIWQWAWDRHGPRYGWAVTVISYFAVLPVWLFSAFSVALLRVRPLRRGGRRHVGRRVGAAVCVFLPGAGPSRVVERWAAGREVDPAEGLEATYARTRGMIVRIVGATAVAAALLYAVCGAIAGATGSRFVQYGIVGAVFGAVISFATVHSFRGSRGAAGQGRDRSCIDGRVRGADCGQRGGLAVAATDSRSRRRDSTRCGWRLQPTAARSARR